MKQILLDANFLMIPAQFKIDVWNELRRMGYQPIVLSCVLDEIKKLSYGSCKHAVAACVALRLIETNNPEIIGKSRPADNAIFDVALEKKYDVATNDKSLIAKLKKAGINVVRLKQRKLIEIE
jgi:rRNA-processing protein FCF1